jgi:hypothetical protein
MQIGVFDSKSGTEFHYDELELEGHSNLGSTVGTPPEELELDELELLEDELDELLGLDDELELLLDELEEWQLQSSFGLILYPRQQLFLLVLTEIVNERAIGLQSFGSPPENVMSEGMPPACGLPLPSCAVFSTPH